MRCHELFVAAANEKDTVKLVALERRLFMIKYGLVGEMEPIISTLNYNGKNREFFHPWSIKSVGITFGSREYSKLISLNDYLKTPVDIIDDLLEGVMEGEKIARKAKEDAIKREAAKSSNKDPDQVAIDRYNQMNKGR